MSQTTCVSACGTALTYVKGKGAGFEKLAKTIEDCISLCQLREEFEKRGSALFEKVKGLCAEACARCASECKAANDSNLASCIEECSSCSDSCK
jgi:hypothetical protein